MSLKDDLEKCRGGNHVAMLRFRAGSPVSPSEEYDTEWCRRCGYIHGKVSLAPDAAKRLLEILELKMMD